MERVTQCTVLCTLVMLAMGWHCHEVPLTHALDLIPQGHPLVRNVPQSQLTIERAAEEVAIILEGRRRREEDRKEGEGGDVLHNTSQSSHPLITTVLYSWRGHNG